MKFDKQFVIKGLNNNVPIAYAVHNFLEVNRYPNGRFQATYCTEASCNGEYVGTPYGYGNTAEKAIRELISNIPSAIKSLKQLEADAREALDEECKNKQEVENG